MASDFRLVYLGTRDFALPTLRALVERSHTIVGVVTQPDRRKGRRREPEPNAIKQFACDHAIPVFQPEDVNDAESISSLKQCRPDLLVLVAYGQILSKEVLAVAEHGGINLHGSLLPRYRGAAPVAWAIYQGEPETGVTVIQMTTKIDAGAILAESKTSIRPDETAGELEGRLAEIGVPLVCTVVGRIASGDIGSVPQDTKHASYARRLEKSDGLIDWSRPGRIVCAQVRAMQPWPTAYAFFQGRRMQRPARLIVERISEGPPADGDEQPGTVLDTIGGSIQVKTGGSTSILIERVQPAGKRLMTASEFQNGYRVGPGDRFGATIESTTQVTR